ncbi:MAG TPA: response regulator [Vicinamibacterales bacterium]|nr:response regulator [Vicinamibacterales bacterium]
MNRILVVDDDDTTRLVLRSVLGKAGFTVSEARDGIEALDSLGRDRFELMLLDVWMPRMTGLDLLAALRNLRHVPRVVVMTSDEAPETLLKAVREQAFSCVHKPIEPSMLVTTVRDALAAPEPPPIEVLSARADWVELKVPCSREAVNRIEAVMAQLETDLPQELRESIGFAFRELAMNAVEWGGKLDPTRQVRISCLRAKRMILYRIVDPGVGFKIEELTHAAIGQAPDDPIAHMQVREAKGLRPGGFGLMSVREIVDELLYNEQRNEVVFVKYLENGTKR